MQGHEISQQTQVEHTMLKHLMEGLRVTMSWQVDGDDASRKLSTLRFMVGSFQRHLERLLALEEHDGYMDLAMSGNPQLGRATDSLRAQHQSFRNEATRLLQRLERMSNTDVAGLEETCKELLVLLRKLDEHSRKEIALLQEAFGRDDGGGEG
jgi:hypothetical protein